MKRVKDMTVEEFKEKFMKPGKVFDFDKFTITCKKCGSNNVEFGGRTQEDSSDCWYESDTPTTKTIYVCKCHACGNAFVLSKEYADDYIDRADSERYGVRE